MYCPICKAKLRDGSSVCPGCGRVITAADRTRLSDPVTADDEFGDIDDVFGETPAPADDVKRFRPAASPRPVTPAGGYTRRAGDPTRPMGNIPVTTRREPERFSYDPDVQTDIYMRTYYGEEPPLPQEDVYEQRPYTPQPPQPQPEPPAEDDTEYVVVKPKMGRGAKVGIVMGILLIIAIIIAVTAVFGKRRSPEPEPVTQEQTTAAVQIETTTADTRPKPGYYRVATEDDKAARVYNAASGGQVTSSVKPGTVLLITQISGERGKTEKFVNSYGQSYSGWIDMKDLEAQASAEEYTGGGSLEEALENDQTGEYTVRVPDYAGGTLNIRSGPGTENTILGKLSDGETVYVDEIDDGWAHVTSSSRTGWCSMDYLEKND